MGVNASLLVQVGWNPTCDSDEVHNFFVLINTLDNPGSTVSNTNTVSVLSVHLHTFLIMVTEVVLSE